MASLFQNLADLYTAITVLFTIILLEFLRGGAARTKPRQSITTEEFLKIVDQKAPARLYKTGRRVEPLGCSVCLSLYEEGDDVRILKCKHTFHRRCLDPWLLQDDATCPLCRRAVLPAAVVVKHRNYLFHDEYYDESDQESTWLSYPLPDNFLRRVCKRIFIRDDFCVSSLTIPSSSPSM